MRISMQLKKPATVGSDELPQPNAIALIDLAPVRLLPLLPTAQLVPTPVRASLTERTKSAGEESAWIL